MQLAQLERAVGAAFEAAGGESPHPNPRVGAVIMGPDGSPLAVGAHAGPGQPHAERLALAALESIPDDATMLVTLEPCNHTGRTPPCTEAIIASGIRSVVVGAVDPDHRVAGSGIAALRTAGIEVDLIDPSSELGRAMIDLDPGYFHHRRTGKPQVVLKLASTLDGQIAALDGTSQWITGAELREHTHRWRRSADAVMVGAGTVIADDPSLDVRLEGHTGRQPRPIVIAGSRPLPRDLRLWDRNPLVISTVDRVVPSGELAVVESEPGGNVSIDAALDTLTAHGILRVFVEGGATLAKSLLAANAIDVGVSQFGPKIAGGTGVGPFVGGFATLTDAIDVRITAVQAIGDGVEVVWIPESPS